MLEREVAGVDDARAEPPEHERVVRVRTMPQSDEQGSEGNNAAAHVCGVPSGRAAKRAPSARRDPQAGRGDGGERVGLHARAAGVAAGRRHRRVLRVAIGERQGLRHHAIEHALIVLP